MAVGYLFYIIQLNMLLHICCYSKNIISPTHILSLQVWCEMRDALTSLTLIPHRYKIIVHFHCKMSKVVVLKDKPGA